jgi:prophage antirepressor-like protein
MEKQVASPAPVVFSFESLNVRVVDRDGEPWFVAADVCAVLHIGNPSDAVRRIDAEDVTLGQIEGSHRPVNLINESGLFTLILRSDKPEAKRFKRWITSEVLPSIRKHGHYGQPVVLPADPMQILKVTYDALVQVNTRVDEVQETVTRLLDTVRLQQWQCYELKAAVTQKAQEFRDTYNCTYALLFPAVWGFVKKHFRVATYSAIPTVRFDEALALVKAITFGDMPDYVRESAGGAK